MLERVRRSEPVDLRQPDGGQEPRERKQVRIGVRDGEARDDVRHEIEREEEHRVRERCGGDVRLARDVHAREAHGGEHAYEDEVGELAVPTAEGQCISPQSRSETTIASSTSVARTMRTRTADGPAGAATSLAR